MKQTQNNQPTPIQEEGFTPGNWRVEIITPPSNCTMYLIANTMGAEYGEEAEANRKIIEQSPTLYRENQQLKNELDSEKKYSSLQYDAMTMWEAKAKQQAKDIELLREALQLLTNNINLSKLNIRKDFSLINAHANGLKALKQTEPKQ